MEQLCTCCPTRVEAHWRHGGLVECAATAKSTGEPCKNTVRHPSDPRVVTEQFCYNHGGK